MKVKVPHWNQSEQGIWDNCSYLGCEVLPSCDCECQTHQNWYVKDSAKFIANFMLLRSDRLLCSLKQSQALNSLHWVNCFCRHPVKAIQMIRNWHYQFSSEMGVFGDEKARILEFFIVNYDIEWHNWIIIAINLSPIDHKNLCVVPKIPSQRSPYHNSGIHWQTNCGLPEFPTYFLVPTELNLDCGSVNHWSEWFAHAIHKQYILIVQNQLSIIFLTSLGFLLFSLRRDLTLYGYVSIHFTILNGN